MRTSIEFGNFCSNYFTLFIASVFTGSRSNTHRQFFCASKMFCRLAAASDSVECNSFQVDSSCDFYCGMCRARVHEDCAVPIHETGSKPRHGGRARDIAVHICFHCLSNFESSKQFATGYVTVRNAQAKDPVPCWMAYECNICTVTDIAIQHIYSRTNEKELIRYLSVSAQEELYKVSAAGTKVGSGGATLEGAHAAAVGSGGATLEAAARAAAAGSGGATLEGAIAAKAGSDGATLEGARCCRGGVWRRHS